MINWLIDWFPPVDEENIYLVFGKDSTASHWFNEYLNKSYQSTTQLGKVVIFHFLLACVHIQKALMLYF